jgi:hypothetical protein
MRVVSVGLRAPRREQARDFRLQIFGQREESVDESAHHKQLLPLHRPLLSLRNDQIGGDQHLPLTAENVEQNFLAVLGALACEQS